MTRGTLRGLVVVVGGFTALLLVASLSFTKLNPGRARGTAIGAALGFVNLAVGYVVTRRAILNGMRSAMATLIGGFVARLLVLAGLIVVFQRTGVADAAAFALTFLVLFFVYLGAEVLLVNRLLDETRRAG